LQGKKVAEARIAVIEWLKSEDLLEKEEDIKQNISTAERTGGIVEPLPKLQWFIDVDKNFTVPYSEIPGIASGTETTLKKIMRASVESGETTFVTERFEKIYFHWVENLRPWCISRQIWFGHRIPVWYKDKDMKVQTDPPGDGWEQDPDVLDTWFSSGLWTFSTLGWPEDTEDLKRYHPTTLIESGYDILPFWIARMILMSGFFLGQVPFKTVYFHGLVRDGQGRKISKSLGNNIDPVDMAAKYGMDAVRVSLIAGMAPGTDSKISEEKIRGYKHFANKVWNIARFVLENAEGLDAGAKMTEVDQGLSEEMRAVIKIVSEHIGTFRIDLAFDALYHFIWDRLAAEIIEDSKSIFKGEDTIAKASRQRILHEILADCLKILHPFMPFLTEEIWQDIPREFRAQELLMIEAWPE